MFYADEIRSIKPQGQGNILAILNVRVAMDSRTPLSADQARAARAILNWSRVRLAAKANLSEMTIRDFENGFRKPRPHNIAAIRQALEDAGIVFNVDGTPSLARLQGDRGLTTERTHAEKLALIGSECIKSQ